MIVAYSRQDYPSEVWSLYRQMVGDGVRPDSSTFTASSLKACASTLDLENGEEIWYKAVDCGYECDVFVGSSVLSLYAKSGKMDEAVLVFKKMPRKDLVCWTTMLTGFVQIGKPIEAVEMFRGMQREGIEFDGVGAGLCKSWGLETESFPSWVYDSERSSYGCYGSNQPCAYVCEERTFGASFSAVRYDALQEYYFLGCFDFRLCSKWFRRACTRNAGRYAGQRI
ncbi:hypothetical protein FF1_003827 [Malus domestica]